MTGMLLVACAERRATCAFIPPGHGLAHVRVSPRSASDYYSPVLILILLLLARRSGLRVAMLQPESNGHPWLQPEPANLK